jgi:hypothetical protein
MVFQHLHGFVPSLLFALIWWACALGRPDWCEGTHDLFYQPLPLVAVTQYSMPIKDMDAALWLCPVHKSFLAKAVAAAERQEKNVNSFLPSAWRKGWLEVLTRLQAWLRQFQGSPDTYASEDASEEAASSLSLPLLFVLQVLWLRQCVYKT